MAHGGQAAEPGRRVFQAVAHVIEAGVGTSEVVDASELAKPVAGLGERGTNVPATAALGAARPTPTWRRTPSDNPWRGRALAPVAVSARSPPTAPLPPHLSRSPASPPKPN